MASTTSALNIDGQEVADLESYRTGSPLFTITFPEDNIVGRGARRGGRGVGGLQLHHRPAAAGRVRDRDLKAVRRDD